jgi:hypothetical protein
MLCLCGLRKPFCSNFVDVKHATRIGSSPLVGLSAIMIYMPKPIQPAHSLADPKSCSSSKKLEVPHLLIICFSFCCFHSGFVIPKGWRIYVYTREINYDPHIYPDPLSFNPWRWLVSRLLLIKCALLLSEKTRLPSVMFAKCRTKVWSLKTISSFLEEVLGSVQGRS